VSSFRPICLLTTLYKLYAVLVFKKVRGRIKAFVSWTQAGFIRGRSYSNNLWLLRRVVERAIVRFNSPVYCLFVARVLELFLYFDAKATVKIKNIIGPTFDLLLGVRQSCFSIR